jgi:hypothetical protein
MIRRAVADTGPLRFRLVAVFAAPYRSGGASPGLIPPSGNVISA